jgi:hypothetical protein
MDTSDDPVRDAVRAHMLGSPATAPGTGPEPGLPRPVSDPNAKKRKRRLAAASVLTRDWIQPTLGTPGLLGIG